MGLYKIQDLGTLPGGSRTIPRSINHSGQIVGTTTDSNGNQRAFLWKDKQGLRALASLRGFSSSSAEDINDSGEIVGSCGGPDRGTDATYWKGGLVKDIDQSGFSFAHSINKKGQITGSSNRHCAIWNSGVVTLLRSFEYFGQINLPSYGMCISTNGQVFGCIGNDIAFNLATKWNTAGAPHDLDVQKNISSHRRITYVNAANDSEVAVGAIEEYPTQAFYWAPFGKGYLGTPPGSAGSIAHDINPAGQIVGFNVAGNGPRAVIWNGPIITDLNSLLDPSSGWVLQSATCLNDNEQIAGWGQYKGANRAWVMSPDYGEIRIPPLFFHIIFGVVTDGGGVQLIGPTGPEGPGGPFGRILKTIPKEYRSVLKNILETQTIPKSRSSRR